MGLNTNRNHIHYILEHSFLSISLLLIFFINSLTSCQRLGNDNGIYPSSAYVKVDTIENMFLFHPQFSRIDFEIASSPNREDTTIVFCCTASFTKERTFEITKDNVAGPFVTDGETYNGYNCPDNNGSFVFYNDQWEFTIDSIQEKMQIAAASPDGIGFSQIMILPETQLDDSTKTKLIWQSKHFILYQNKNGNILFRKTKHRYRALCQLKGKLCIAELRQPDTFQTFKDLLSKIGVEKAIYLDVGFFWSYAWYRIDANKIIEMHRNPHPFISNWLIFRK